MRSLLLSSSSSFPEDNSSDALLSFPYSEGRERFPSFFPPFLFLFLFQCPHSLLPSFSLLPLQATHHFKLPPSSRSSFFALPAPPPPPPEEERTDLSCCCSSLSLSCFSSRASLFLLPPPSLPTSPSGRAEKGERRSLLSPSVSRSVGRWSRDGCTANVEPRVVSAPLLFWERENACCFPSFSSCHLPVFYLSGVFLFLPNVSVCTALESEVLGGSDDRIGHTPHFQSIWLSKDRGKIQLPRVIVGEGRGTCCVRLTLSRSHPFPSFLPLDGIVVGLRKKNFPPHHRGDANAAAAAAAAAGAGARKPDKVAFAFPSPSAPPNFPLLPSFPGWERKGRREECEKSGSKSESPRKIDRASNQRRDFHT